MKTILISGGDGCYAKKLKESKAKARAEKRQKKKEVVKEETPETTE